MISRFLWQAEPVTHSWCQPCQPAKTAQSWGNCLNPSSVQHEPWQTYKNIHAQGPTSPKFIRLDLEGAESFRIWPCLADGLIQLFYSCFFFRPWGHLSDLSIHSARPTDTSLRPAPTPGKAARQGHEPIRSQDKRDVQFMPQTHKHVLDKICDSPHGRGENEHIPTMADWYYLRITNNYEFFDLRVQNRSVRQINIYLHIYTMYNTMYIYIWYKFV